MTADAPSSSANENTPLTSPYGLFGAGGSGEGGPCLAFLTVIDAELAATELALKWKWVLAGGILNVVFGTILLCTPIFATAAVLWWIAFILTLVGLMNIGAATCGYTDYSGDSTTRGGTMLAGFAQLGLGILAFKYPMESLLLLTVLAAVVFMTEGLFRMALAFSQPSRTLPGWIVLCISGACNVALSLIIVLALPYSAAYTVGILVGVNVLTLGFARISLGLVGRNLDVANLSAVSPELV